MSTYANPAIRNAPPRRTLGQLWQVPTFVLGLVALTLVAARAHMRPDPVAVDFQRELQTFRQALDDKNVKAQSLLARMKDLQTTAERLPKLDGEASFLIGTLYWRLSEEGPRELADAQRVKAQALFETAQTRGVPPADQVQLDYRLGMVLDQLGQESARAAELLARAAEQAEDVPLPIYDSAIKAMLRSNHPDLPRAINLSKKWLERAGDNEQELARARLTHGELLMRSGNTQAARRILERIKTKDLRVQARTLEARCCEADTLWEQARPIWDSLLADADSVPGGKARIYLALGDCDQNSDVPNPGSALDNWQQALHEAPGSEEAQAAALHIGWVQSAQNARDTLKSWTAALTKVRKPAEYHNAYVALDKLRGQFETFYGKLVEAQDYPTAVQTAELYERVAQPGKGELLLAQACEKLGLRETDSGNATEGMAALARAAEIYGKLSQAGPPGEQAEPLWHSASCHLQAKQYAQAIGALEKLLSMERVPPARLAETLLALGDANAALQQKDPACQAYNRCVSEYRETPSAQEARYRLAVIEAERQNVNQAIIHLHDIARANIADAALLEKSQYLLSTLLFQKERLGEAELTLKELKEAGRQNPTGSIGLAARALLAECYLKMARQAQELQKSATPEFAASRRQAWIARLEQARSEYQSMAEDLEILAKLKPLNNNQLLLERKALFCVPEIYGDMNEFRSALNGYQKLQRLYPKKVEGLVACQRIVNLVSQVAEQSPDLVRHFQQAAREALAQAESDLQAMNANDPGFQGSAGVWSKQDWQTWIQRFKTGPHGGQ